MVVNGGSTVYRMWKFCIFCIAEHHPKIKTVKLLHNSHYSEPYEYLVGQFPKICTNKNYLLYDILYDCVGVVVLSFRRFSSEATIIESYNLNSLYNMLYIQVDIAYCCKTIIYHSSFLFSLLVSYKYGNCDHYTMM